MWPNLVGLYEATVALTSLPQSLQTVAVGAKFGALPPSEAFAEVCGSPGEVAQESKDLYPFHRKDEPLDLSFEVVYDQAFRAVLGQETGDFA